MVILEGRGGAKNLEGGDRGQVLISTSIKGRDRRQQIWQTASIWSRVAQSSLQMSWRCSIQHQLRLHAPPMMPMAHFVAIKRHNTKSRPSVSTLVGFCLPCALLILMLELKELTVELLHTEQWSFLYRVNPNPFLVPRTLLTHHMSSILVLPCTPNTLLTHTGLWSPTGQIKAYIEEHGKHQSDSLRASSWSWRCSSCTERSGDILAL